jgi:hypothetical protein
MNRISPEVRQQVLERDHLVCLAPVLDPDAGSCRDRFGNVGWEVPVEELELDHVGEMRMGRAAPTDIDHLVTLCPWHHRGLKAGRNWATSHRPMLRAYLRRQAGNLVAQ